MTGRVKSMWWSTELARTSPNTVTLAPLSKILHQNKNLISSYKLSTVVFRKTEDLRKSGLSLRGVRENGKYGSASKGEFFEEKTGGSTQCRCPRYSNYEHEVSSILVKFRETIRIQFSW